MKPTNSPNEIRIIYPDGSCWYTTDTSEIRAIGLSLPKVNWNKTSNLEGLRNSYFLLLEELAKHGNTGYTKVSLHEAMKPLIMKKFSDFGHYFTTRIPEYSTKNLTHEGWVAMISGLKETANDVFGFSFG